MSGQVIYNWIQESYNTVGNLSNSTAWTILISEAIHHWSQQEEEL